MPSYTLKINRASINAKITKALSQEKFQKAAYKKAFSHFLRAKNSMLKQFNEHPITVEIEMGPKGVNFSNTLDGYGNLFAFIGFNDDERPTENLRTLLENLTLIRPTVYRNRSWYFRISTPSREEIESETQMPWERGSSWAYSVESNISGLSHFMYKQWSGSRSGTGFQLPYENLEEATFSARPYMSEILASFRRKINNT